jgi:hypothetical protein
MKLPDRDSIVERARDEINPADDKKAACEKEIRTYLGLLDQVVTVSDVPNPADFRDQSKQVATALRKFETIVSAYPHLWASVFSVGAGVDVDGKAVMVTPVNYDRFMADVATLIQKADFNSEHLVTTRESKRPAPVKMVAAIHAVRLFEQFRSGRRGSEAKLAAILYEGATGIEGEELGKYCAEVERRPRPPNAPQIPHVRH